VPCLNFDVKFQNLGGSNKGERLKWDSGPYLLEPSRSHPDKVPPTTLVRRDHCGEAPRATAIRFREAPRPAEEGRWRAARGGGPVEASLAARQLDDAVEVGEAPRLAEEGR
jgi:hypothetical protein